jgi:hypothetical protein
MRSKGRRRSAVVLCCAGWRSWEVWQFLVMRSAPQLIKNRPHPLVRGWGQPKWANDSTGQVQGWVATSDEQEIRYQHLLLLVTIHDFAPQRPQLIRLFVLYCYDSSVHVAEPTRLLYFISLATDCDRLRHVPFETAGADQTLRQPVQVRSPSLLTFPKDADIFVQARYLISRL